MRILLIDLVDYSDQSHRLAAVILRCERMMRYGDDGHDAMKALFISLPPEIDIISGYDRLANEAEAEVAETERGPEVMITIRYPEEFFRIRPAASANERQRDSRAAQKSRLATLAGIRRRARRICERVFDDTTATLSL